VLIFCYDCTEEALTYHLVTRKPYVSNVTVRGPTELEDSTSFNWLTRNAIATCKSMNRGTWVGHGFDVETDIIIYNKIIDNPVYEEKAGFIYSGNAWSQVLSRQSGGWRSIDQFGTWWDQDHDQF
jgi:hypothetical protein